eukprot:m.234089 g.234089  ORF g.234089 m.234089 type:complete len:56 (+) comp19312_c0_seq1:842-1009(+)
MLLQASADVHARNNEKLTPYDLGKAHPATARLLIPRGAAPISSGDYGDSDGEDDG